MPVRKNQAVKILIPLLVIVFLLASCKKAAEEKIPLSATAAIYKLELSPAYATKDSSITVKVKNANPPDVSYQWMVNDREIEGATKNALEYPDLKKNDKIQVKVSIKDVGELISDSLTISNIIPTIKKAKVTPRNPKKGDELKVEAETYDGDGDSVSLSYEWFINEQPLRESSGVLTTDDISIKRGNRISVKITPTDREQEGKPIILNSIFINSPPKVSPQIKAEFNGLVYTSKIMAEDPEGDTLTYTLKKAPNGMTIDTKSGVITWQVKPEDKGEHEITVSVSDGQGGEVVVLFTTTINFTSPE